jgi:hypothetical protein
LVFAETRETLPKRSAIANEENPALKAPSWISQSCRKWAENVKAAPGWRSKNPCALPFENVCNFKRRDTHI